MKRAKWVVCKRCLGVMRSGWIHSCPDRRESLSKAEYRHWLYERREEAAERNRKDEEHDRAGTV